MFYHLTLSQQQDLRYIQSTFYFRYLTQSHIKGKLKSSNSATIFNNLSFSEIVLVDRIYRVQLSETVQYSKCVQYSENVYYSESVQYSDSVQFSKNINLVIGVWLVFGVKLVYGVKLVFGAVLDKVKQFLTRVE